MGLTGLAKKEVAGKYFKRCLALACLIVIALQASECFPKLLSHPAGTSISVGELREMPTVSICKAKAIYVPNTGNPDYTIYGELEGKHYADFYGWTWNSSSFWHKRTGLEELVQNIYLEMKDSSQPKVVWGSGQAGDKTLKNLNYSIIPSAADYRVKFCYSFEITIEGPVKRIIIELNTVDTHFILHKKGQMYMASFAGNKPGIEVKELSQDKPEIQDYSYYAGMEEIDMTYMLGSQCQDDTSIDLCVHTVSQKAMKEAAGCTVPFGVYSLHDRKNISTCRTSVKEKLAMATYTAAYVNSNLVQKQCKVPCKYTKNMLQQPQPIRRSVGNKVKIILNMPKHIKQITSFETYSLITFIAEFGGWVSLLVGVSLLDVVSFVRLLLPSKNCKKVKHPNVCQVEKQLSVLKLVLLVVSLYCLTWQFYLSTCKLWTQPTATNINYGRASSEMVPDFTFCATRGVNDQFRRNPNMTKMTKVYEVTGIKTITTKDGDEWKTLWDNDNASYGDLAGFMYPEFRRGAAKYCHTYSMPELSMAGRQVKFSFRNRGTLLVSVHQKGYFFGHSTSMDTKMDKDYTYSMKISSLKLLPTSDHACQSDPASSFDECLVGLSKERMMDEVGCIAPIEPNLQGYCGKNIFQEALAVYREILANDTADAMCPVACETVQYSLELQNEEAGDRGRGSLTFVLSDSSKTTEVYHYYSLLSYVAEFGGWTGLFLGVSIVQANDALEHLKRFLGRAA